jgi:hypothetical protein
MSKSSKSITASCSCGKVQFNLMGAPIMRVACYCTSCRTAGLSFAEAFGSPSVVADDGGTDVVLYRKDRVVLISGGDHLDERRLTPASPTRRMVAACCGTPMVMEFTKGHWLNFYSDRLPEAIPALDMRVMTEDKLAGAALPHDVPVYATRPAGFMWKLVSAWMAMGFRRPKLAW